MAAPIHDANLKMTICKENLDQQKDTIHKFASSLRQKLHIGDICPVCRQQIKSELPHEEALAALVSGLQHSYNEAEKSYQQLIETKNKLEAEINTESKAYHQGIIAFDNDHTVANAEAKAAEACKACGLPTFDDAAPSALATLESSTTIRKTELDHIIKDGELKETTDNFDNHTPTTNSKCHSKSWRTNCWRVEYRLRRKPKGFWRSSHHGCTSIQCQ